MLTGTRPSWRNFSFFTCLLDRGAVQKSRPPLFFARRRTAANIRAALPDMDGDMRALAQQTLSKLERMTDADYDGQKFHFTDE